MPSLFLDLHKTYSDISLIAVNKSCVLFSLNRVTSIMTSYYMQLIYLFRSSNVHLFLREKKNYIKIDEMAGSKK